jgi:hypothetical protein
MAECLPHKALNSNPVPPKTSRHTSSQALWPYLSTALRRLRQKVHKFKDNLCYITINNKQTKIKTKHLPSS